MKIKAFTIIELFMTIVIIVLLAALLVPSLIQAKSLARKSICAHQLHQIDVAFRGQNNNIGPFCKSIAWPTIPMNMVSNREIYICPEDPFTQSNVSQYYLYSNVGGKIPFADQFSAAGNGGLCRLFEDDASHSLWGFDDGVFPDLWGGSVDIYIYVDKTPPITGINMTTSYQGHATGTLSLYHNGAVVPGWEDFRTVATGARFVMSGNDTNYGINSQSGSYSVSPGMIILLDFCNIVANRCNTLEVPPENVRKELDKSARHLGKINVLRADGSVNSFLPQEIDPSINPMIWNP